MITIRFSLLSGIAAYMLLAYGLSHAAPTLTADPYPDTGVVPDTATLTVNGGVPISCTLPTVAGGKQPTCDLASVTAPGVYTLVLTVTKNPSTVMTGPNAGTTDPGGSASSAPFVWTRRAAGVGTPVVRIQP